jgi:glucan phosphoethanolaminetransferase (alkaline phosphatase superfamily)
MSPRPRDDAQTPPLRASSPSLVFRAGARARARARRWLGRALLTIPAVVIVLADVTRRREQIRHFEDTELAFYLVTIVLSLVLWGALLAIATRRDGPARHIARVLLVALAIFAFGGQSYTFDRYQAYLNHRAVLVGTTMMPSVGQQLWSDRVSFAVALVPPVLGVVALALGGMLMAPLRRRRTWLAADVAAVAFVLAFFAAPTQGGEQGATPDVLYLSAMGQLARAHWDHNETVERIHPGPRSPIPVPPFSPRPPVARNVVLIVTESVRTTSVCVAYDENCKWTPFSNQAAKGRLAFTQMRALDSTTAISLAIMWSGLLPTESRAALHSAPLIWEYARAGGWDGAYWTSQNLLFGNSGTWIDGLPLSRHVSATEISPTCPLETGADDGKLVNYVVGDIGGLREPYFGVVHLSNTHFPYEIDPDFAPFQPQEEASGPGYEVEIRNRYQDAIILQDRAVGRLIDEVRKRPEGPRTVIVYVSDHGEQMREKGAVGHTGTLFDPEIRIPLWIDAPAGTLTADEERNLRALANAPITSLDLMPTLLDLMGMHDAPELASLRARMPGRSLLRGGTPADAVLPLTNCSELWACAFKNWGAIQGTRKLVATTWDHEWNCYDVATDPEEERDLGVAACADLRTFAETTMHGRPFSTAGR